MGKLTNWHQRNWWTDLSAPWPKRRVLALLRRNWKHRKKVANARDRKAAAILRACKLT